MEKSHQSGPSVEKEALSLALDFVPFVGSAKSFCELVGGKDIVTGEHINRWFAAGGILIGFLPFGKALLKMRKEAKVAKSVAYGVDHSRKEITRVLDHVFGHHNLPLNPSNAQSRYQYELLRKQLRLEEGMISTTEKELVRRGRASSLLKDHLPANAKPLNAGNPQSSYQYALMRKQLRLEQESNIGSKYVGGHAFTKHGLGSKFGRDPKTGEFRSAVGHDYGRFGKERLVKYNPTGQSTVLYEPIIGHRGDLVYALNTYRHPSLFQDLPLQGDGHLGVANREELYNLVKRFLKSPSTKPILEEGKIIGYKGKEMVHGKSVELIIYTRAGHEGTMFINK